LYGEAEGASFQLPGVEITEFDSSLIQAKFDLNVELTLHEAGVGLRWTYDKGLFTERHIEQLNSHLCRLLEALSEVGENTEVGISNLAMLSEREVEELVYELNDTAQPYPEMACIHDLFEEQVANAPEQTAVVFEGRTLSYRALNEKANQVAHYLRLEHGVGPDTLVGLCIERSLEMVIGIMGILKAGGAYVPLDPNYPAERLSYLLADTAVDIVLSGTKERDVLGEFAGAVLCLDGMADTTGYACADYSKENLDREEIGLTSSHLAYVIYTSGSTGQPKGVMVEHKSVVNLILSQINTFQFEYNGKEVGILLANYAFDAAVEQLFCMLLTSNTIVIPSFAALLSPVEISKLLEENKVTHIDSTPSHLLTLGECLNSKYLRRVVSGGESISSKLYELVSPKLDLYNVYGPTEASVTSSVSQVKYSIGRPIANVEYYILGEGQTLVPSGAIGELYIGGAGVARGYLNKEELTMERFIENPFRNGDSNISSRLYRTGDLVRYLPSGYVESLGRIDDQVKIRGFRIELGEIENTLSQLSMIDSTMVLAQERDGNTQLVAYVKLDDTSNERLDIVDKIKEKLALTLPSYMIPSGIAIVETWPSTPNGKINKHELLNISRNLFMDKLEFEAPKTDIEQVLVSIWAEVLMRDYRTISINTDFFLLGGHSLLLAKLADLIYKRLNKNLSLSMLFGNTTIKSQVALIEANTEDDSALFTWLSFDKSVSENYIFIPGAASTCRDFIHITRDLKSQGFNVGEFRHVGMNSGEGFFQTIGENVEAFGEYLFSLEDKKVTLVGHSYGGVLALELSTYLRKLNVEVELILLDTYFNQPNQKKSAKFKKTKVQTPLIERSSTVAPIYLLELYQHQANLFDEYKPDESVKEPVTFIFANQSSFCQRSYKEYLEKLFFQTDLDYMAVSGDHFSMLEGENAESITKIITRSRNEHVA
ncbi:amino acid adenylation domain-containing protein, partial [Pseudoalteromonas sp. OF7H-1]|uniref:amino acid adenylation domain-containing protein n=2 Tax=unclassified Pseudoalteromonas TaxID=194690 RepID=UPI001EF4CD3F